MTHSITELLEGGGAPDQAAVDAFLEGAVSPLVDGHAVTYLYRGEATEVRLRHFILGFPTLQPFHRVDETDLWFLTMEIPPGSRIEYKLEVRKDKRRRLILDPLNPNTARDPFGLNSVCYGEGYRRPDWTLPDLEAREGRLETIRLRSDVHDSDVELPVYLPARLRKTRRYPLLIVFDGEDFLRYAALSTVLDNLIHRYEIPPLIVACSQSPDRFADYTASEDHARFVAGDLLPGLAAQLPLLDDPAERGLMGASLGAVAALWTAWRNPGTFGKLLLQSGSFRFNDTGYEEFHPALWPVVEFVNDFRENPVAVADSVAVTCGRYEALIADNRALQTPLRRSGMRLQYREARDGHNWENWRDRLRGSLTWLFPGPLGLVYE